MESLVFLIWILCGVLAAAFGSQKGTGCMSAIIGFLLGPIGLIVVILDKGNRINCPYCRQLIDKKAVICPFCRSSLVSPPTNSVRQEYKDDITQSLSGSAESTPNVENHTSSTRVYHNDPPKQVSVLLAIGIVIMPYIFVWVLLKKGYSDIVRVIGFGYLLIMVVIMVVKYNDSLALEQDLSQSTPTTDVVGDNLTTLARKERMNKLSGRFVVNKLYTSDPGFMNSVDLHIYFTNKDTKTIKYINFTVVPYNAVNDPVECTISHEGQKVVSVTGPINPGQSYGDNKYWSSVWFNSTISYAVLDKIDIEYTDGTRESIKKDEINAVYQTNIK